MESFLPFFLVQREYETNACVSLRRSCLFIKCPAEYLLRITWLAVVNRWVHRLVLQMRCCCHHRDCCLFVFIQGDREQDRGRSSSGKCVVLLFAFFFFVALCRITMLRFSEKGRLVCLLLVFFRLEKSSSILFFNNKCTNPHLHLSN